MFFFLTQVHALPPVATRHVGDLPNLNTYDNNGIAWFDYVSELVYLQGTLRLF